MHITGMCKSGSLFIKLLQGRKYNVFVLIMCQKSCSQRVLRVKYKDSPESMDDWSEIFRDFSDRTQLYVR